MDLRIIRNRVEFYSEFNFKRNLVKLNVMRAVCILPLPSTGHLDLCSLESVLLALLVWNKASLL